MNTKLKHIFFLAALSFAFMACGGSVAKPVSGLDVSVLPDLLTISPRATGDRDTEHLSEPQKADAEDALLEGSVKHQQLTINN